MPRSRPHRRLLSVLASALLAAGLAAGCGGDASDPVSPLVTPGPPDTVPPARTAAELLLRLEAALELRHAVEYDSLLAADYRFHFSPESDPDLVTRYGTQWGREDELAALRHLFTGFTDDQSILQPGATRITLQLNGATIADDPDHADSTAHYRRAIVPSLDATVELSDGTVYELSSLQEFYLVRGDAAVLTATEGARSDRWYLRRWEDHATALALRQVPGRSRTATGVEPSRWLPARPASWGSLRGRYR
jgi:hypothetical protein